MSDGSALTRQQQEFLAVVIRHLPQLSAEVMQGWIQNQSALAAVLARLAPSEHASAPHRQLALVLAPEAMERFVEIRDRNKETNAGIFRKAVRVFDWFDTKIREGWQFQIVKDDIVREIEITL